MHLAENEPRGWGTDRGALEQAMGDGHARPAAPLRATLAPLDPLEVGA